ncbi:hypothetical protein V8E54_010448 [Elaphomyces granulatus]
MSPKLYMLKVLLNPMGGIVLTNDGHAILREIEIAHPAAKSMIELSRTQDEKAGDGTTTVIILAGKILAQALPSSNAISTLRNFDAGKRKRRLSKSRIDGGGKKEADIKRYSCIEKFRAGDRGYRWGYDKDITHPKMRRKMESPIIVLLDCPLEYKKGESQTNIKITKEDDWNRILTQRHQLPPQPLTQVLPAPSMNTKIRYHNPNPPSDSAHLLNKDQAKDIYDWILRSTSRMMAGYSILIEEDIIQIRQHGVPNSKWHRLADALSSDLYQVHINRKSMMDSHLALRSREYSTLRKWHNQLGHRDFRAVGAMMNLSVPRHPPVCAACQQGKMKASPQR